MTTTALDSVSYCYVTVILNISFTSAFPASLAAPLTPDSAPSTPQSQRDTPTPTISTTTATTQVPPPIWALSISVPASTASAHGTPTTWALTVSVPASSGSSLPTPFVSSPGPYCVSLSNFRLLLAYHNIFSKVFLNCVFVTSWRHRTSLLPPTPLAPHPPISPFLLRRF